VASCKRITGIPAPLFPVTDTLLQRKIFLTLEFYRKWWKIMKENVLTFSIYSVIKKRQKEIVLVD
jgi:hypothetical protein